MAVVKRRRSARVEYDATTGPPQPGFRLRSAAGKLHFPCPFCGSDDANARCKLNRDGVPELFIACFGDCPIPSNMYLQALSEAFAIPGATKEQLVEALFERLDIDGHLKLAVSVVPILQKYGRPE